MVLNNLYTRTVKTIEIENRNGIGKRLSCNNQWTGLLEWTLIELNIIFIAYTACTPNYLNMGCCHSCSKSNTTILVIG